MSVGHSESVLSFSKLFLTLYRGRLLTKWSLSILTSSCHVSLHSQELLWLYWLDGLEGPLNPPNWIKGKQFHGFGRFWGSTEKWKEIAPWTRKFKLSAKVNVYLKPASTLNLKKVILKRRVPQTKIFKLLKPCILKWENGQRMNWPLPPKKYLTPDRANPLEV